jgi:NitT/TauT family transport system ATP-binding protein/nitrate/nitrite transport system substrate-binding protein
MRDKLAANVLDAGQLLAPMPMPLAGSLALDHQGHDLIAAFVLSRNGNAITFSRNLYQKIEHLHNHDQALAGKHLKVIVNELKLRDKKLTFATVYPYSCHYLQLVSYFEQGGIDHRDINIVIISPTMILTVFVSVAFIVQWLSEKV